MVVAHTDVVLLMSEARYESLFEYVCTSIQFSHQTYEAGTSISM